MSSFTSFKPPDVKELEAKRNIQGLIDGLNYRENGDVRRAAADAIGKLGYSHGPYSDMYGREVEPNPEYEWRQNGIEWRQDAISLIEETVRLSKS